MKLPKTFDAYEELIKLRAVLTKVLEVSADAVSVFVNGETSLQNTLRINKAANLIPATLHQKIIIHSTMLILNSECFNTLSPSLMSIIENTRKGYKWDENYEKQPTSLTECTYLILAGIKRTSTELQSLLNASRFLTNPGLNSGSFESAEMAMLYVSQCPVGPLKFFILSTITNEMEKYATNFEQKLRLSEVNFEKSDAEWYFDSIDSTY